MFWALPHIRMATQVQIPTQLIGSPTVLEPLSTWLDRVDGASCTSHDVQSVRTWPRLPRRTHPARRRFRRLRVSFTLFSPSGSPGVLPLGLLSSPPTTGTDRTRSLGHASPDAQLPLRAVYPRIPRRPLPCARRSIRAPPAGNRRGWLLDDEDAESSAETVRARECPMVAQRGREVGEKKDKQQYAGASSTVYLP